MTDVFKQYVEGLEELDTYITSRFLTEDVQEEGKHVLLQEEAETIQVCVYKRECTCKLRQDDGHDCVLRNEKKKSVSVPTTQHPS